MRCEVGLDGGPGSPSWNSVLARAEVDSTYEPARRLWRRERMGHYVPNASLRIRTTNERGEERFEGLVQLMRLPLLEES